MFCIATRAWTSNDVKSICVAVRSSANPTTDDRANRRWNTARQRELSATNCNSNDLGRSWGSSIGSRIVSVRSVRAAEYHRGVDRVTGHELLRLGGERFGFGIEGRRLGLGEEARIRSSIGRSLPRAVRSMIGS